MEIENSGNESSRCFLCETINDLLSDFHAGQDPYCGSSSSASLVSAPPKGEIRNKSALVSPALRRKAIARPSGDQAGQTLSLDPCVRRSSPLAPTTFV